jgi:hypothetical protein
MAAPGRALSGACYCSCSGYKERGCAKRREALALLAALALPPRALIRSLTMSGRADATHYHDDAAWADVEPLEQDDGELHPLAAIAYTDEYREAMGYLRAVMAAGEYSARVLALTAHIISMNPAHYTVW